MQALAKELGGHGAGKKKGTKNRNGGQHDAKGRFGKPGNHQGHEEKGLNDGKGA